MKILLQLPMPLLFLCILLFSDLLFINDLIESLKERDVGLFIWAVILGIASILATISLFKLIIDEYKSITKNHFFDTYFFPKELSIILREKYPHLKQSEIEEVLEAMIFLYRFSIEEESFYMPSRVVDFAFQTFVDMIDSSLSKNFLSLDTLYHRILPKGTTSSSKEFITVLLAGQHEASINFEISYMWCYCCKKEYIDPFFPLSFPSLFTLDQRLKIPSGFIYELDETLFRETHSILLGALSVSYLRHELQTLDEIERVDIDYWAKKIQYYLGHYSYCNQYQREDFEKLFRIIDKNQPLAHAVYGNYSNVNPFQKTVLDNSAPPPSEDTG